MGVEPKIGGLFTPKWMVKIMETPMNKWMIWGFHYFWKHLYKQIPPAFKDKQISLGNNLSGSQQ